MTQAANPPAAVSTGAAAASPGSPLDAFQWAPQPQVTAFLRPIVEQFLSRCPGAAELARRMRAEMGTRFDDWIETIVLPDNPATQQKLLDLGYARYRDRHGEYAHVFAHPGGMFPRIGLHPLATTIVHIKVDRAADFAAAWQLQSPIEGDEFVYRRVRAFDGDGAELIAAERWGWTGFDLPPHNPAHSIAASRWLDRFRARRRAFDGDAEGFVHTAAMLDACLLDTDHRCALFFAAERDYWMSRNRAAQVQYARQQRLGLGWGNHDHHTYRSSRANFAQLVAVWEKLGLHCRERFYAGREAGWGAQVMEQPYTGIITFNDVDLSPDELLADFAHEPLHPRDRLGTVGLWCGLHGDSFLQSGMHHLEAQFDFDSLRQQLEAEAGVRTMKPFTDFPHLRQAFTEGERWPVSAERIERLLNAGLITAEQAKQFRDQGALGSHLENLERNDGFKGFNQTGVSEIIAHTDPRRHVRA
jgi:hypothetical protein